MPKIGAFFWTLMVPNGTYLNRTCQKNHMFKGSSDSSHFIFEINVGKRRIRHRTTLNLNDNKFGVDLEIHNLISSSLYVGSNSFRH